MLSDHYLYPMSICMVCDIIRLLQKQKGDLTCACVFSAVQNLGRPYWLTLSPMYLWMLVFFTRPHKEERFLFPIYPLICLSGAVALSSLQVCFSTALQYSVLVDFSCIWPLLVINVHIKWAFTDSFHLLQKCYHFLFQRYRLEHYTVSSNWLALSTVAVFTVLSLSRSVALFRGVCVYPQTLYNNKSNSLRCMKSSFFFSVYRLPCPSRPVPRVPSHCQGSDSSLRPWRQTCKRLCWQRVVPLPKQLPPTAQVSTQDFSMGL